LFLVFDARQIPPRRAEACNTLKVPAGGLWGILNQNFDKKNITVLFNVQRMIGWCGIFTMIRQSSKTLLQRLFQNFTMCTMSVLRDFLEFRFSGVIACFMKGEAWIQSVGNMNSYYSGL